MEHTPGPWRVVLGDLYEQGDARNDEVFYVVSDSHGSVATVDATDDEPGKADLPVLVTFVERTGKEGGAADARLIAAAPDLLAALELALPVIEFVSRGRHFRDAEGYPDARARRANAAAREAIAKAHHTPKEGE